MKKIHLALIGLFIVVFLIFLTALAFVAATGNPVFGVVGTVPVRGELVTDSADSVWGGTIGTRELAQQIETADKDPTVSVILLDINSGGGSVVASKELMQAVKNAKKPVVAYIGDMGASGAYYVASAADEIVADEDSMTGSIGVVALIPNYVGLMEKIGVNMTVMKEGENKVMGNPYEEFTPEQREIMKSIIDDAFSEFKQSVLENRHGRISEETLASVADGRIMNGNQALKAGLIDRVGSRKLALERAASLGGIEGEPYERVFYPYRSPFAGMFSEIGFYLGKGLLLGLQSDRMELKA
jgi:protease-4